MLLCKDLEGYQNLCQIVTRSYTEAPPAAERAKAAAGPRALVDRELLDKYGDGLIVLSGCLRGEIPYKILTGESRGALESLLWFKKRFGEDFYLELQDTGMPEQDHVNELLYAWGEKHGIECVATTDCHYLEPKDCEAHEVLQCIEHGKNLDFDRPKSLVPAEYYLKPASVMRERFERYPGRLRQHAEDRRQVRSRVQVQGREGEADLSPSELPSRRRAPGRSVRSDRVLPRAVAQGA